MKFVIYRGYIFVGILFGLLAFEAKSQVPSIWQRCMPNSMARGVYVIVAQKSQFDFSSIQDSRVFLEGHRQRALSETGCSSPGGSLVIIGINPYQDGQNTHQPMSCRKEIMTTEEVLKCINDGNANGAYLEAFSKGSSMFASAERFISSEEVRRKRQAVNEEKERSSRIASEKAEIERKLTEEKNAIKRQREEQARASLQDFVIKSGGQMFMAPDIEKNPFRYEGRIVLLRTKLLRFIAKDKAEFEFYNPRSNRLLVASISAKNFSENGWMWMAARVDGAEQVNAGPMSVSMLRVLYVNHLPCRQQVCEEYDNLSISVSK